jgi:hypothetical protein
MLGKGKGGAETFGAGSAPWIAVGAVFASSEDGTNRSGSKEGRRGYSRQSPKELKDVCRVSLSVKRTHLILDRAGSEATSVDEIVVLSE